MPSNNGGVEAESEAEDKGGSASPSISSSNGRTRKLSATLEQIWKDDFDSGNLLVTLSELFGEPLLPFVPFAEMSLFL